MPFLAAEAVGVVGRPRAGTGRLPAIRVILVLGHQRALGVHEGGDVAVAIRVVGSMERGLPRALMAAQGQQPTNPTRTIEGTAQVTSTGVGLDGCVVLIPLLHHKEAVINPPHLVGQRPAGAVPCVILARSQAMLPIVGELGLDRVRDDHLHKLVLIVPRHSPSAIAQEVSIRFVELLLTLPIEVLHW